MKFDLVISNGLVYDGTGREPERWNLGISGNRIAFTGREVIRGKREINAEGLIVAPGFIDVHGHSDFTLLSDGRAMSKVLQGITLEIGGNCGLSAAPLIGEYREARIDEIEKIGIEEQWTTLAEYRSILERRGISINFGVLCGHGNLRGGVMGYSGRKAKSIEIEEMSRLLSDTLSEGALGLSTGLIYPPGCFADTDEIIDLVRVLDKKRHIYATHIRGEGERVIDSVKEVLRIGEESGRKVHISHLKTWGEENWNKLESILNLINFGRGAGISVTADRYPYVASFTDLDVILPEWAKEGGRRKTIKRLKSSEDATRIRRFLMKKPGFFWNKVMVSFIQNESYRWVEGMKIAEIGERMGLSPVDTVIKLLVGSELRAGAIYFVMSEENLERILSLTGVMVGSDSSSRSLSCNNRQELPHPRAFGTFPRFLKRYVIDERLFEMKRALRMCTGLAADTFKLKDRGYIKEGFFADITVFDPESITDRATYRNPTMPPQGIEWVIVNGDIVVEQGLHTGARPGMFIS